MNVSVLNKTWLTTRGWGRGQAGFGLWPIVDGPWPSEMHQTWNTKIYNKTFVHVCYEQNYQSAMKELTWGALFRREVRETPLWGNAEWGKLKDESVGQSGDSIPEGTVSAKLLKKGKSLLWSWRKAYGTWAWCV